MTTNAPSRLDDELIVVRPLQEGRLTVAVWATTTAVFVALVSAWEGIVRLGGVPVYLLPAPTVILERLLSRWTLFVGNGVTTLLEALAGFGVGGLVAFVLATAMAHSRLAERVLYPIALLIKVTPIVAIAPLFVIWFGFGPLPKILIAALITFFPMLVNALAGLRAANPAALDFLRSVGASTVEIFLTLRVPGSLPYLFAAARVAVPLSLIGAVVGEWWGASEGLGRIIFLANTNLDMPSLFAAVVVLTLLGVGLTSLLSLAERRMLRWHESVRG
ncbi:MAG: ABC transporter permease [Chloroflexota bacterium]|nr:ABC transporter permease [Dehalococcoidia bacterium]MDW8253556.1 ABC transporter permease [Chloroflexota bacterium]